MKKIFPLLAISLLLAQSLNAQEDSISYEQRPFQFTFLFPPLSTNGAKNAHTSPSLGVKPWNEIAPYSFYSHTGSSYKETRVQMWVGLQGSISF